MVPPPRHKMPGTHAEPVPGRCQSGSFPLCPVGESAPFPASSAPNWRQNGSFPLRPWANLRPCSTPSAPNQRQSGNFPPRPVGELAPFSHPRQLGTGVRAAVCPPCAWAVTGTARHTLSGALRREISPLFSRSFAFMREKRKMYSVQKFPCPSGTIASALKIVPKPIDNLRRVLYNATMLLR